MHRTTQHSAVPVCKPEERAGLRYLESDTLWINPSKAARPAHLYTNNLCPPEYSELGSWTGGPCYASTSVLPAPCPAPSERSQQTGEPETTSCSSGTDWELGGTGERGAGAGAGAGSRPPEPPPRGPSSYHASRALNTFGAAGGGSHYECADLPPRPRRERRARPRKPRRRLSDAAGARATASPGRASQSVTSSPALSRKSGAGAGQEGGTREAGEAKVSEEINDMVEQIQAIQADISQLAGRPISLYEYHRT